MTLLWANDTHVALSQAAHARKAISLIETLFGQTSTGDTIDHTVIVNFQHLSQQVVDIHQLVADRQSIRHGVMQLGAHFLDISDQFFHFRSRVSVAIPPQVFIKLANRGTIIVKPSLLPIIAALESRTPAKLPVSQQQRRSVH
jgi:hypothetical protein